MSLRSFAAFAVVSCLSAPALAAPATVDVAKFEAPGGITKLQSALSQYQAQRATLDKEYARLQEQRIKLVRMEKPNPRIAQLETRIQAIQTEFQRLRETIVIPVELEVRDRLIAYANANGYIPLIDVGAPQATAQIEALGAAGETPEDITATFIALVNAATP
jgi:hypothetical protein